MNVIAWGLVAAVVVYVLAGLDHAPDSRTEVVRVSEANAANVSEEDSSETSVVFTQDDFPTPGLGADPEAKSQPDEIVALNDSAAALIASGNLSRAVDLLKRAVAQSPDYARAHYNLGIAYQRLNRLADAIAEYRRASSLRPHYYEPAYNLGRLYSQLEENDSAVTWLLKAAGSDGSQSSAPAHYNLGIVYRRLGKKDLSEKSYREAIRLQPAFIEPRFNLALLLKSKGDYRRAAEEFEKVQALGYRPAKVYRNLGICYSNLHLTEKAAASYAKWAELDSLDGSAWYNLAIIQARLDDTSGAMLSYHRALKADSTIDKAAFNLGLLYSNVGMADSARAYYHLATRISPSYSRAFYNLADVFYDGRRYDSAAFYFLKVTDLDPENHKALFNLALSYAKAGYLDEAIGAYRSLVDQDPTNVKATNNLGTAYLDAHKYDSALVCFNRLVGLTDSPKAYFNRAKTYHRLDSLEAAKKDYRQAIKRQSDYAAAYHNLAILEDKTGNPQEAADLLLKALKYEPHNWKSFWKLGQVYVEMGLTANAVEAYSKAAAENPPSEKFRREYEELTRTTP